jgi:two-component system phosphate regulon sensor histidine kinase PhoR
LRRDRGQALRYAADEGVIVADAEGRITSVNPAGERILGSPAAELVGGSCWEVVEPLLAEGRDELAAVIEELARCPLPGAAKVVRVAASAGSRAVEMRLSPLVDLEGSVVGIVGVLRDVVKDTEIDRARSEFIAAVSHELRGPATSIRGYADLLASEGAGSLSEEQKQLLTVLKRNSDRLSDLINDLLDLSLIDSGQARFDLETVEMGEVVADVVAALSPRAETRGLALGWDVERATPPVLGDKGRLRQVLVNLVDNAISYTEEGGRIGVRVQPVQDAVRVDVEDTGIGIPAEELGRVFDRFFRGSHDLVRASPGTGLGLSIVETLVEMHGGRVWVESTPGRGSRFTFILPFGRGQPSSGAAGPGRAECRVEDA